MQHRTYLGCELNGRRAVARKRLCSLTAAAVAGVACVAGGGLASAAPFTYYWDPASTGFQSDGAGPWDTTSPIWYSTATSTDGPYANDPGNVADFGTGATGPAGFGTYVVTVNQASGIQVGTINFTTAGYNLTGGAITLGSSALINNTAAGIGAYIASTLTATSGVAAFDGSGQTILAGTGNSFSSLTVGKGDVGTGGNLNISGGSVTVSNELDVEGYGGLNPSLYITGGSTTVNGNGLQIATDAGKTGNVYVSGGSLTSTSQLLIGKAGSGTLNVTGGTVNSSGSFILGYESYSGPSEGTLNLSGSGVINSSSGDVVIGNDANTVGIVNQKGGTFSQTNGGQTFIISGNSAGSGYGIYNISGGNLNVQGYFDLGHPSGSGVNAGGAGILLQTGGTITATGPRLAIGGTSQDNNTGNGPSAVGVWDFQGGTTTVNSTQTTLLIGAGGNGYLSISGGTFNTNYYARVGGGYSDSTLTNSVLDLSAGSYNATGSGKFLTVGEFNNGTLNVRGGTLNLQSNGLNVGGNGNNGQTSIVTLTGGTIIADTIATNPYGSRFFNFNGGTVMPSSTNFNLGGFDGAYVYGGGAAFNTSMASNATVSQALLAPSGSGVSSIAPSASTTYLEPPIVAFSGGGGTGASGIATLNSSGVPTILITSPGQGYTTAPTVTLIGITSTGSSTTTATANISSTTGGNGGLTKIGPNTLTLTSTASSFTGDVNINGGTLSASGGNGGGAGPLGATQAVTRNVNVGTGTTPAALIFTGGDTIGAGGGTSMVSVVVNAGSTFTINAGGSGNSLLNLTLNGATLTAGSGYSVDYPALTIGGNVTVGGTAASTITSSVSSSFTGGANNIDLGFAGQTTSATFNVPDVTGSVAADLTVSVPLGGQGGNGQGSNSGTLIKTGGGTLALAGGSFDSGGTTISAGTLQANAPLSLSGTTVTSSATGTGTVTVSGGVLAGTGGAGPVVVASGGTITGGTGATTADTVGTLTTTGQTWNGSGAFVDKVLNLGNTSSGNDRLVMSGLTINATSGVGNQFNVSVGSLGGTQTFAAGGVLVLADDTDATSANPFSGSNSAATLASLNLSTTGLLPAPAGYSLQLGTQADTTGGGGYDLILADVVSTPEPTSLMLLLGATAPLLARRRRPVRA
jgi:hypothetical protein